jgi:peptidyl-prolyl cis-trans isomerase B (cyclophilin B)
VPTTLPFVGLSPSLHLRREARSGQRKKPHAHTKATSATSSTAPLCFSGEGRAAARGRPSDVPSVRRAALSSAGRLILAAPLAALLVACGGSSTLEPPPSPTPVPEGTTVLSTEPSCTGPNIASIPRDGQRSFDAPPEMIVDPSKTYTAVMATSRGAITIDLDAADAPNTVNNFVFLSCHGYYDGLAFFRVDKDPQPFVIQGGDPRNDGTGGPGYIFEDEFSPNLRHDGPGVVSMANSGPGTNGSQFFITLAAAESLDDVYSAFGRVTEGLDVVNAIIQDDKILAVSITES